MLEPVNPMTDKTQVREQLYADPGKLGARMDLHARFATNPLSFADWELGLVDVSTVRRALDVGCGTGNFLLPLARRLAGQGASVVGVDLSAGVLHTAWGRVEAEGLPVVCQIGDIEALPFVDGTFDLVLANYMLYHVPNLDRAIAELRRVLRAGGTLLAATNGLRTMPELLDLGTEAARDAGVPEGVLAALLAANRTTVRSTFSLENGAEWLGRHFAAVRLERYPDELRVTDAEALTDYFASMWTLDMVAQAAATAPGEVQGIRERIVERFRARVQERIAREGCVRISKDTGAFVAA